MIERRALLKAGLLLPAAYGLPAHAKGIVPPADAWLIDRRVWPADTRTADGLPVHWIDGDVTALWYGTLDQVWRKPGMVLAGYTGSDALFVLERLAWHRGRRVVARREVPARGAQCGAVSWVIAPVHPSVKA